MGKTTGKMFFGGLVFSLVIILTGCNSAKDLSEYVEVDFNGIDSKGTADYRVDIEKLIKDTLDFDVKGNIEPDEKITEEINKMDEAMEIKLDKTENLSNGDKIEIIANVDGEKTKKVKSGKKTIEVKNLDEPKWLTNEEVEKKLVVNFNGVSGRGEVQIDNVLDSPLDKVKFTVENDGELKNGDKVKVTLSKDEEEQLLQEGYLLEKDFAPTFEVKGLSIVAEKATDISNLDDIKRMIDEEVKRDYQDFDPNKSWGYKYEIKEEKLMYRQFNNESDKSDSFDSGNNGNLIKIFSVKKFSGGSETKLNDSFTAIIGYSDIILDEDNKVNLAEMKNIKETKDDTYSLESVIKMYEAYGYTEVK